MGCCSGAEMEAWEGERVRNLVLSAGMQVAGAVLTCRLSEAA